MSRQYINIQYTLTKDFFQATSGLCGYMDDISENDLMTPDGKVYNVSESTLFVESCKFCPSNLFACMEILLNYFLKTSFFLFWHKLFFPGRIDPMVRVDAGVAGSWSWTESNFHPQDKVDITYTDPNFKPQYSLEGFTKSQIYAGM